jgi:hypothetical protein
LLLQRTIFESGRENGASKTATHPTAGKKRKGWRERQPSSEPKNLKSI